MKIRFLGGVGTVTGTCIHIAMDNKQVLVDCGMYQGEGADDINRRPFLFDPSKIDYLFLTHAHIDHSGLIPKLTKEGFRGKILATSATKDLTEIMLYDSAHIQEMDSQWLTKKALRKGIQIPIEPIYSIEDVRKTVPLFKKKDYDKVEGINNQIKYRFIDAGHILGSSTLELWYQDKGLSKKIVFSGDIGKKGNPIINDPKYVVEADYVVVESTYGNRSHKDMEESINELVDAINTTFKKGGNVLIPAFAVGRTQDLLYILNKLVREKRLNTVDVYVDSPLAEEATKVYLAHPECFDEETMELFRKKVYNSIRLHFTKSVEDSQRINKIKSGAIIIAGSGMCEGGRIRHHLKHNLWRPECSIIFVGFQAKGTLGRRIIDGSNVVNILGEEIAVRAKIYTIGGFSAHADQKELLEWLSSFKNSPEIFIVHGEENASKELERVIKERLHLNTYIPRPYEEYEI